MMRISWLLFLILSVLVLSCTQTNEKKAQVLVKNYLDSTLYNPGTYKPISFTGMQPYSLPYESTGEYQSLTAQKKKMIASKDSLLNLSAFSGMEKYQSQIDSLHNRLEEIGTTINTNKQNYKGKNNGWWLSHTYTNVSDRQFTDTVTKIFIISDKIDKVLIAKMTGQ